MHTAYYWNSKLHTVHTAYYSNSNLHAVHTAYDQAVLAVVVWSWVVSCVHCVKHNQCTTPYAVIHGLVLLMMGIMMPETC